MANTLLDFTPNQFKEYPIDAGKTTLMKQLSFASCELAYFNKVIVDTSNMIEAPSGTNDTSASITSGGTTKTFKVTAVESKSVVSEIQTWPATTAFDYSSVVFKVKGKFRIYKKNDDNTIVEDFNQSDNEFLLGLCYNKTDMYLCVFGLNQSGDTLTRLSAYKVKVPEVGEIVWSKGDFGIRLKNSNDVIFGLSTTKKTTTVNGNSTTTYTTKAVIPEKSTFLEGIHASPVTATFSNKVLSVTYVDHTFVNTDSIWLQTMKITF